MQRRPVCAIEDLPPGTMKLVQAGKFGVGVYNIDGSLYAIANYCSHEGAPLCLGYVSGTTEYDPEMPDQIAMCAPVRSRAARGISGSSTSPPARASPTRRREMRTYEVDVSGGQVFRMHRMRIRQS